MPRANTKICNKLNSNKNDKNTDSFMFQIA